MRETTSQIQLLEKLIRTGATETGSPPRKTTRDSSTDELAARLGAIEARLADLARSITGLPYASAMEFDVNVAPARSQTEAAIRNTAQDCKRDRDSVTKSMLFLTMRDVLMKFGRPDSVNSLPNGGARWLWETEAGYSIAVDFSWGKVVRVGGDGPN